MQKLVANTFTCAHCGEPITGELVVGIKLSQNEDMLTGNVFFHDTCHTASGNQAAPDPAPVC